LPGLETIIDGDTEKPYIAGFMVAVLRVNFRLGPVNGKSGNGYQESTDEELMRINVESDGDTKK
jgi:hypothetical protein